MTSNMYMIYDNISSVLLGPCIIERSHASAIRGFNEVLKEGRQSTLFNEHPADFELWYIGEIDLETGIVDQHLQRDTLIITTGKAWLETQK